MSEIKSSLPDDYATVERPVPHRETILRQTMHSYVRRYGQDTPLDLDRFNRLLATSGQPLATKAEVRVWYGHPLTGRQRN